MSKTDETSATNKTTDAPTKYKQAGVGYESNPFKVVIRGFNNVFNYNSSVVVVLMIVSIVVLILDNAFGGIGSAMDSSSPSSFLLIFLLVVFFANLIIRGMSWLTGIQSAKHKKHDIDDYFKHTMTHFWALIGFYFLYSILAFFGFLFFIVPGIIFSYWYSLAPIIILDQNKPVFEAMDLSKKMVQGMFWEWIGVYVAAGILSVGGILSVPSNGGGKGLFYQQLKTLKDTNTPKPKTHWLNYLLFGLLIAFFAVILLLAIFIIFFTKFTI